MNVWSTAKMMLAVFSFCNISSPIWAQITYKIGANVELTGPGASIGGHSFLSAQIALDEINAKGGVNGHKLEFVTEDNRTSPEQAVVIVRNLDRAGVVAVFGPVQTSQARTAFPAANRAEVVSISPGSGAPGLTSQNRPWAFRNAAIDQMISRDVVKTVRRRYPQAKTVALTLDPRDAYFKSFVLNVLPPELEKEGFTILNKDSPIEIPSNTQDHSVFVTKIKDMKADVFVMGSLFDKSLGFLREANRQQLNIVGIGGLGYVTDSVAEAAGSLPIFAGQPFNPYGEDAKTRNFVSEFKRVSEKDYPGQYSIPSYSDAGGYEVVMMIADALRESGLSPSDDVKKLRTAVRDHFASLKGYQGLGSTISFNAEGDAEKDTKVYVVENGKWVIAK